MRPHNPHTLGLSHPAHPPVRVGAVQLAWHADAAEHQEALAQGVRLAADEGVALVCLQELTLSPYFAVTSEGPDPDRVQPEQLETGPTMGFAAAMAAETGVLVHASLYEERPGNNLGYNTAIVVGPDGRLLLRTRKLHIPITTGYYEDRYFTPGPAGPDAFHTLAVGNAEFGFPTCWDQWFPELPRAYSLQGAAVLVYPTAIGSEPDHPDFDTEPLWEKVIVGNGIANGTFMVACQSHRHRASDSLLWVLIHIRPLWSHPRAGTPRRAGGPNRRLGRGSAQGLALTVSTPLTRRPDVYGSLTDSPQRGW